MDRRRLLIAAGLIATAAAALAPFAFGSCLLRWPVMFVWGGAAVALYTIGLVLLGERFRGGELASANAAFIMMYNLGWLLGPPIAGYAMQLWRPHGFIAVIAGLTLLHVAVTSVMRRTRPT
jgi:MFS family permease